jgi:histidyl-tRNA synthetase
VEHFEKVKGLLKLGGVPYKVEPMLVRGLDYYTRTAFEIKSHSLGAQNAVAGGGRYDNLIRILGGPNRPAIGFAIGMERAIEILKASQIRLPGGPQVFIVALGQRTREMAFSWLLNLREMGIRVEMAYQDSSIKSQLRQADKIGARYVLMVGENEISKGAVVLKAMEEKAQWELPIESVPDSIKNLCQEGCG